jgi:hypothetical protein
LSDAQRRCLRAMDALAKLRRVPMRLQVNIGKQQMNVMSA